MNSDAPSEIPSDAGIGNPFPGLRPFEEADNVIFFGRDAQIEALLERLQERRFVAVVGTSASGKSSLVRAGLLPALRGGFMAGAGARWRVALFRPGNAPIANFIEALDTAGILGSAGAAALRIGLAQAVLEGGERGLAELVAQAGLREDENVLIVVDQFEELFRFTQNRDETAAFVKLLLAAAADPTVSTYVLLTMRSDFLGDCAHFRDLPETINDGLFLVPRLARDELREAIEGPVGVAGSEISPLLVNRLLNEIGDSADQLPVLQHALMRTWEIWLADSAERPIDGNDFDATGGLARALSKHGDALYEALSPHQQTIAERLFKALTDCGSDNRGIRRPTAFAALPAIVGASVDEVRTVIDEFRGPGRSFVMPPAHELDDATVIDIAHESLMRIWERLQNWVLEEAESAQTYRRLADASSMHDKGEGALLVDPQLSIAATWRDRSRPTAAWAERYAPGFPQAMDFLDASLEERARQRLLTEERERLEQQRERREFEAQESAKREVLEHEKATERLRADAAQRLTKTTRRYLVAALVLTVIAAVGLFGALVNADKAQRALHGLAEMVEQQAGAQSISLNANSVDYDRVVAAYTTVINLMPTDETAYTKRGFAYIQTRKYALSIADFTAAIRLQPRDALAYRDRGVAFDARGDADNSKADHDRAIADENQAINLDPELALAFISRGEMYRSAGNLDLAIADANRSLQLDPKLIFAYVDRGNVYDDQRKYDEAIAEYNKAIDFNPNFSVAYYNRSRTYVEKGDYVHALSSANDSIRLNPKDADSYVNRGNIYYHQQNDDRAIADAQRAIRLEPSSTAYVGLGNAQSEKNDHLAAIASFNAAVRLNPKDSYAFADRGNEFRIRGDHDRAIADYTRAIALNPSDAYSYNGRGLVYAEKHAYARAISDYGAAIRIEPKDAYAYNNRGDAYEASGDLDRAAADHAQAHTLKPDTFK